MFYVKKGGEKMAKKQKLKDPKRVAAAKKAWKTIRAKRAQEAKAENPSKKKRRSYTESKAK